MVPRTLEPILLAQATRSPVLTVTGPRQSGKTTLCRAAFPAKPYLSLEPPDIREFAQTDPRGFLAQAPQGAIIDEVQHVPSLLSYIQAHVDEHPAPGAWVLSGSQHFGLLDAVSQTLAGRTTINQLLPLSLIETRAFPNAPTALAEVLWTGGYPRIHDRGLPPTEWLGSYVATYVERDVRHVLRVADLMTFQTFVRLCAGRAGQLLNLSALGADAGVSQPTARQWLNVLEGSYLTFRLPALHANLRKRLVKTPKLYFHDTGLLCYLLGIREPGQLAAHPLRGAVFENWVVTEVLKAHVHQGVTPTMHFYRDTKGHEVDLVIDHGGRRLAVEIKAGQTIAPDAFDALDRLQNQLTDVAPTDTVVAYGGAVTQHRSKGTILAWSDVGTWASEI